MVDNVLHGTDLVLGLRYHLLKQFLFTVLLGHDFQLVALLGLHARVGHVGLTDALVEQAALLLLLVAHAVLLVALELVDDLVLDGHGDVAADLVLVLLGLDLVLDELALNHGQLVLVLALLDVLERAFLLGLDCHLELEFGAHLLALLVQQLLLFLLLVHPLRVVLLNLLVPLSRGHSDNFALVCGYDLLVAVNHLSRVRAAACHTPLRARVLTAGVALRRRHL